MNPNAPKKLQVCGGSGNRHRKNKRPKAESSGESTKWKEPSEMRRTTLNWNIGGFWESVFTLLWGGSSCGSYTHSRFCLKLQQHT